MKGKRSCPKCQNLIGIRSKTCNCGHVFITGEKVEKPLTQTQLEEVYYYAYIGKEKGDTLITTPAGKCPSILSSPSKEDVNAWCNEVTFDGKQSRKIYMKEALIYYIRQFYEISSNEYSIVKKHVIEWVQNIISIVDANQRQSKQGVDIQG